MSGDLHCHTKLSDGTLGIEDLIVFAKKKGAETIAITDHDCLAGTVRGKLIGARFGVQVIPGVELSATDTETGKKVHLLCYLPDVPERLEGLCRRNMLARKKASHFMMLQLVKKFPISPDFIVKCATGSTGLYKQHMMQALMECGYTTSIYGELYDSLFNPDREGNILITPTYADAVEVIGAIHDAGGIAVLAHPYLFNNVDLIDRLVENGLDGVEVWHPSADEGQREKLRALAVKKGLLMTGGTDFHGAYNKDCLSVGDCVTPDDAMAKLLGFKAKRKRQQKKLEKQMEMLSKAE